MEKIPTSAYELIRKDRKEIYNEVIKYYPFLKGYCNVDYGEDGGLVVEIHDGNKDLKKRKYLGEGLRFKLYKLEENIKNTKNKHKPLTKTSTPWRPEIGEIYFYIDPYRDVESACKSDWGVARDYDEEFRYKSGNCFRTEEEAGAKLEEIMGREV